MKKIFFLFVYTCYLIIIIIFIFYYKINISHFPEGVIVFVLNKGFFILYNFLLTALSLLDSPPFFFLLLLDLYAYKNIFTHGKILRFFAFFFRGFFYFINLKFKFYILIIDQSTDFFFF